jgi:hypothetical protein
MPLKYAKPPSKAAEKATRLKAEAAYRAIVYRLVKKRDRVCRCCGSRTNLQHHHIRLRSAGGPDTTANICLLCDCCHADRHAARLTIDGASADHTLRFVRAQ